MVRETLPDGTKIPLPGVTLAFDQPDGTRVELATDATGRATFDGIDWSLGRGAVTAHRDTYALASVANLDATSLSARLDDNDELPINLSLVTPAPVETVTVTGSATGSVDSTANFLNLLPLRVSGTYYHGSWAAPFSFEVEPNKAFTLIGLESRTEALPSNRGYHVHIERLISLEVDALTADPSSVDIDFAAHEVTPKRADGTFALPTRADSPLRSGSGFLGVMDEKSPWSHLLGWSEQIERAADGSSFTVSYIWTEPAAIEAPVTVYIVSDQAGNFSEVLRPGYPVAGELDLPVLDVPRWVTPANPAVPHPLASPLQWELFDDIQFTSLQMSRNNKVIWYVDGGPNATSVTVPAPPSTVDRGAFLGQDALSATLMVSFWNGVTLYPQRGAVTRAIVINPQ